MFSFFMAMVALMAVIRLIAFIPRLMMMGMALMSVIGVSTCELPERPQNAYKARQAHVMQTHTYEPQTVARPSQRRIESQQIKVRGKDVYYKGQRVELDKPEDLLQSDLVKDIFANVVQFR